MNTGFFTDKSGKKSMIRLLSFIVVIGCLPMLYLHPDQSPPICVLIGTVIGAKSWQANKESV